MTDNNRIISNTTRKPFWLRIFTGRSAFFLIFFGCILFGPYFYFQYQISQIPDIDHPFDLEAFGTVEIKPEENSFVEYQQASSQLVPLDSHIKDDDFYNTLDGDWSEASNDVIKWLDANQEAMKIWKRGTEKPDFLYHQPKDQRFLTDITVIYNFRDFARLAKLQSKRLCAAGKVKEAWEWHRATFRSSRHAGMHGTTIERINGVAIHAMVTKTIIDWANEAKVDSRQLSRTIELLTQDYQLTELYSKSLKGDYLVTHNILSGNDPGDEGLFSNKWKRAGLFFFSAEPEYTKRVQKHLFKNWSSQVDQPHHKRHSRSGRFALFNISPIPPNTLSAIELNSLATPSTFSQVSVTAIGVMLDACDIERTRQSILLVTLAAQQYKRDHGKFPPDSAALIKGKYLKEMPLDAMQQVKTKIQYRHTAKEILIYG